MIGWEAGDEAEAEALTPKQTGAWVDWEGEGGGGFGLLDRGRGLWAYWQRAGDGDLREREEDGRGGG